MSLNQKLGVGAVLAIFGGVGIAAASIFGLTNLSGPGSFIAGFFVGISAGVGVALIVAGFIERRIQSKSRAHI